MLSTLVSTTTQGISSLTISGSQINYRETYFQHPSLTKIHGDPTCTSLALLEKECKANGKSVRSTLGGGNQGHLGLVSSVLAYERYHPFPSTDGTSRSSQPL